MLYIALFLVWAPTFIVPPIHKYLRNRIVFICYIVIGVLISGIYTANYVHNLSTLEKSHAPFYISPLVFVILYKVFDMIVQRKLNRHMYFNTRYATNKESLEQTTLEWLLQLILIFVPLICGAIWLSFFD